MISTLRTPEWDEESEAVAAQLPTFYSTQSSLYRLRAKLLPVLPKSHPEINIEGKWTETSTGENFPLANDGDEQKILICGTTENLIELSAVDTWYMDGTFYSSPSCFYQLYTIHAMVNGYMCPLVYGLLPNKTEVTYRRVFELLQNCGDNSNIRLLPTTIMMDFECGSRRGVQEVFPTVVVKGCYFHYTQCIWRRVQAYGLVAEFKNNETFKTLVRRAGAMPLVPVNLVEDVWFTALEDCDSDLSAVTRFKDYVTEQWVEGDKALWNHFDNSGHVTEQCVEGDKALWNHFDNSGPRTTNHVEGWHNKINSLLTHSNPNIYRLIDLLKKEQAINEVRLMQYASGGKQRPRKRVYRTIDQRLLVLKQRLSDGSINLLGYVDAASQLIKLGH